VPEEDFSLFFSFPFLGAERQGRVKHQPFFRFPVPQTGQKKRREIEKAETRFGSARKKKMEKRRKEFRFPKKDEGRSPPSVLK